MKPTVHQKPDIFEHLNIHNYLLEYYQFKKSTAKGFSYESWAIRANINSRSLLRMVVTGKRPITMTIAQALHKELGLSPVQTKYYFLLVEYSRARSNEQKKFYIKQITQIMRSQEPRAEITHLDFFSSHWLPKIQTLLSYKDINKTTQGIASLLGIATDKAQHLLEQLMDISYAQKTATNVAELKWESSIKKFKVPEAIQNASLKDFYIQAFEDAKNAIALPPKTRKFRSLLIPLSENEYLEILEKLEEAFQDILSSYSSDELKNRRLYQLTTSLVPITKADS